jgi:hypothetical protein
MEMSGIDPNGAERINQHEDNSLLANMMEQQGEITFICYYTRTCLFYMIVRGAHTGKITKHTRRFCLCILLYCIFSIPYNMPEFSYSNKWEVAKFLEI